MKNAYLRIFGDKNRTISLGEFVTIGTDDQCQIRLQGEGVSERHARIEKKDGDIYVLKDLRSETGTYLNETRVLEAVLNEGNIVKVGDRDLLFTHQDIEGVGFALTSRNEVWNAELQALGNVARTDFPVLILGPSGTGKDVIAHALHDASTRRDGPLVSVNCSALSETLIESELFGHVKGSFTGAINDRKGAFETARGGTLFLDEIGDLSYSLQAKLLRALENNEIRPVGSDRNVTTDVRIIAATHQNLNDKIRENSFRADLYFRLNVVSITPPALVHRMEDFEDLVYKFAKKMRVRFSFNAIARMKRHPWYGNIRELKNSVTRAAALYPNMQIEEDHIEKILDKTLLPANETAGRNDIPVMKEIEKQMIIKRLAANRGNQKRTAADLGMPKSTLHDRLKYYNIDVTQFKV